MTVFGWESPVDGLSDREEHAIKHRSECEHRGLRRHEALACTARCGTVSVPIGEADLSFSHHSSQLPRSASR